MHIPSFSVVNVLRILYVEAMTSNISTFLSPLVPPIMKEALLGRPLTTSHISHRGCGAVYCYTLHMHQTVHGDYIKFNMDNKSDFNATYTPSLAINRYIRYVGVVAFKLKKKQKEIH